jgi:hypothetical protein
MLCMDRICDTADEEPRVATVIQYINFLLIYYNGNGVLFFLFGAVCWSLWLNKNDWMFRNMLISSPRSVIYKLIFFGEAY